MREVSNQIFVDESIELDGVRFTNVKFDGCILIYGGKEPVQLQVCDLDDCQFSFRGHAALTLDLVKAMCQSNLDNMRQKFKDLLSLHE